MRIGILTFHWASNRNFGASLQSYACMKLMEKYLKCNEVKIIDYNPTCLSLKGKLVFLLTGRSFIKYNKNFLNLTSKCKNFEELKNLNNKFDIFVVGSDQVWRGTELFGKKIHYFFDFVNNDKKKIAYAASFGIDQWEGDEKLTEKIKPLIKNFNHISVREESGINICKKIFEIDNAICVLDPTLMIARKDYQPILNDWKDRSHLKKKYIAHMLLDDTKQLRKGSKEIAAYLKADINYIKGKTFKLLGRIVTLYKEVSQWLTYLKDAELIITDSFHCTVFSLIFHKKFIVIANSSRGIARLETLLNKVGLEERFFTNIAEVLESGILDKKIDYEEVDKKLEAHRKYSMDFLKKSLED